MNKTEELLQRCFDSDLNDAEMKELFRELGKDAELRKSFRSLQSLRNDLRSITSPQISSLLDERIGKISVSSSAAYDAHRSPMRRMVMKKMSVSIPAMAAVLLILLMGSYFAAVNFFVPQQKTEYVYVVEMPAYVVQSSTSIITNN